MCKTFSRIDFLSIWRSLRRSCWKMSVILVLEIVIRHSTDNSITRMRTANTNWKGLESKVHNWKQPGDRSSWKVLRELNNRTVDIRISKTRHWWKIFGSAALGACLHFSFMYRCGFNWLVLHNGCSQICTRFYHIGSLKRVNMISPWYCDRICKP